MTNQEKQLANRILESNFNPLDAIRILIDLHQIGSEENKIYSLREEFEKRVLMVYQRHKPVFGVKIEGILYSFFWRVCNPFIQKHMEEIQKMITEYPLYTEDDWVQEYDEWTFNLADHIQETLHLPYSWLEDEEENCGCES